MKTKLLLFLLLSFNLIQSNTNFIELSKNSFIKIEKIEKDKPIKDLKTEIDYAILKFYLGEIFESEKILEKILKNKSKKVNTEDEVKILYFLSQINFQIDFHEKSFKYISEAKKKVITNNLNKSFLTEMIELHYSYFIYLYGDRKNAKRSIEKVINNNKNNKIITSNAYLILGLTEGALEGNYKSSTYYCNKALIIFNKYNLPYYKLKALYTKTNNLYAEGKYKDGINLAYKYYKLAISSKNNLFKNKAILLLCDFNIQLNELNKAKFYLNTIEKSINIYYLRHFYQTKIDFLIKEKNENKINKVLEEVIKNKNISNYMKINFVEYGENYFAKIKNYEKAYYFSSLKANYIFEFEEFTKEILNDNNIHEFRNKFLNSNLEISKKNIVIRNIIILTILVLSISILFYFKSRNNELKIKKLMIENKKMLLENEIKLQSNKLLDYKIYLNDKNKFIEDLKQLIDSNKIKNNVDEIINFLNSKNENPIKFESNLELLEFENKLLLINSTISQKEIKIATLIKLNYSTKEISLQLNITTGAIDNYRSSLRKKLKLKKNENLYVYLNSLN